MRCLYAAALAAAALWRAPAVSPTAVAVPSRYYCYKNGILDEHTVESSDAQSETAH